MASALTRLPRALQYRAILARFMLVRTVLWCFGAIGRRSSRMGWPIFLRLRGCSWLLSQHLHLGGCTASPLTGMIAPHATGVGRVHDPREKHLRGVPVDGKTYDYRSQTRWNREAGGELWRYTLTDLRRVLPEFAYVFGAWTPTTWHAAHACLSSASSRYSRRGS